jgi:hypothetical protein
MAFRETRPLVNTISVCPKDSRAQYARTDWRHYWIHSILQHIRMVPWRGSSRIDLSSKSFQSISEFFRGLFFVRLQISKSNLIFLLYSFLAAYDECSACLHVDPTNLKAYYRRGIALSRLDQPHLAILGRSIVSLDPFCSH